MNFWQAYVLIAVIFVASVLWIQKRVDWFTFLAAALWPILLVVAARVEGRRLARRKKWK